MLPARRARPLDPNLPGPSVRQESLRARLASASIDQTRSTWAGTGLLVDRLGVLDAVDRRVLMQDGLPDSVGTESFGNPTATLAWIFARSVRKGFP